jgi:hypothetical protein
MTKTEQHRLSYWEKNGRRWADAVTHCKNIIGGSTRKVWVCDREADSFEYIDYLSSQGDDFLIRSKYPREIKEGPFYSIRDAVEHAPSASTVRLKVTKKFKRQARDATLNLRYMHVTLCVPEYKRCSVSKTEIPCYVVDVREIDPPAGEEPIHWRLLTSLEVNSSEDAQRILSWYQKRWAIEELFKIVKSGCRAEQAQFHTSGRLEKYTTLSLIVAWRIYYLVHINRVAPDAPASSVMTESEIETLQLLSDDKRTRHGKRRKIIKTANDAITQIAHLGGYLDRKHDPYPGITVLWKGVMCPFGKRA